MSMSQGSDRRTDGRRVINAEEVTIFANRVNVRSRRTDRRTDRRSDRRRRSDFCCRRRNFCGGFFW